MREAAALGWALVAGLGALGLEKGLARLRPEVAASVVTHGVARAVALTTVALLVARLYAPERPLGSVLGLRPTHRGLGFLALGLGAVLVFPFAMISAAVRARFPASEQAELARLLLGRAETPAAFATLVFVSACLVPLVDELAFRGAIFGLVARARGAWSAAITSALGFALASASPRDAPGLLLVGAVAGLVRATSGSLLPCIALHVSFGATLALGRIWGVADVMGERGVPTALGLGSWLVVGVLGYAMTWVGRHSEAAERARAEDEP